MQRYHSLDSLRASMMLLGIWLHTVVGYSLDGGWPYKDAHPTAAFDWTLGLIHTFRMPVFMAMAGFFGALLWVRRGDRAFAENRIRRILVPFVLGWLAVFPLALFLSAWSTSGSLSAAARFLTSGAFVRARAPGSPLVPRVPPDPLRDRLGRREADRAAALRRPSRRSTPSTVAPSRAPGGPCSTRSPASQPCASCRTAILEDPPGFRPDSASRPRLPRALRLRLASLPEPRPPADPRTPGLDPRRDRVRALRRVHVRLVSPPHSSLGSLPASFARRWAR